ncbi:MAG TPA: hypothetical protein VMV14_00785 [Acidimicrobiales bacterium]|nr:hypothetical protein [Acidimicrobiales bacterium]
MADPRLPVLHTPGLVVALAEEDWTGDAVFHEYTSAVDPIGSGRISPVPIRRFAAPEGDGPSGTTMLDLSGELGVAYPATGPSLLARFVSVAGGESVEVMPSATSALAYCLAGEGTAHFEGPGGPGTMAFARGDVLTLPAPCTARYEASTRVLLYHVDDSPLLSYLGTVPAGPRFRPTRFDGEAARAALAEVAAHPDAGRRNRVAVLLGNSANGQTLTATHTLWAMLGALPAGAVQRPHRHQSIALDLIVECRAGCYSLVGTALDEHGAIIDPVRVEWEPGCAFVTPPGLWHSHHNESGADASLFPVQDAGLHTYLRTLDIRFSS